MDIKQKRTLIRNVMLNGELTHILIEGNRFSDLRAPYDTPADIYISGEGKAILPPFYNAHTHAAMTLLRGYADDLPLQKWLTEYIWPYEAQMKPEDIYNGSRLAILEMIKSGTVFFSDMYWAQDETIRAVAEMGIRATIGVTLMDGLDEKKLFRYFDEWKDPTDGRITLSVAPHAIYTVSEDLFLKCAEMAEYHHVILHTHLSETRQEVDECIRKHGKTPVRWLDSLGVLTPNVIVNHAVHVDEEEIDILKERGVTVVHNPCSNMKLSSGIFPTKQFIDAGCHIALGTDGCSSNNNLDMREGMKVASLLAKVCYSPEILPVKEIFKWATENGAQAYRIDGGVIAVGKLADALLIDLNNERMQPCYDLLSNWVYSADSGCIDTVICNGRVIMEQRRVQGEDDIIACIKQKYHRV